MVGSLTFQEVWVADFAMQVEERLAWGCGIWLLGAGWVPVWRLLSTNLNQWRVGSWIVTLLPVTEFWVGRASSRGGLPLIQRDFAGLALCLDSVEGTPERSRRGFPSSKHS